MSVNVWFAVPAESDTVAVHDVKVAPAGTVTVKPNDVCVVCAGAREN